MRTSLLLVPTYGTIISTNLALTVSAHLWRNSRAEPTESARRYSKQWSGSEK
jgi:hypothetical protein